MDDAILRYLEEHDVKYTINLVADDEVIASVEGYDLDEAIAQSHKLPLASDYANEELIYELEDYYDRASKELK